MDLIAPMRLYTLSKRHFVLVFVVFFICFGLIVFIGIAGPEIIVSRALPPISSKSKGHLSSPLKLQTPGLSTYNQELWLMCRFEPNKSTGEEFRKNIPMMVAVSGVMQDTSVPNIRVDAHNHTRSLHCTNGLCDEIIVLHLGYLNYTEYVITVTFYDLENPRFSIKNVNFTLKMYNALFSQVEIWFRFIFVVFTFMVTCLFAHSLRKVSLKDWSIEQKWMSILLPLLLLYNDPFFPLSFLVNSWFPGMLDDLFQAIFLCALLLFWLCAYHGFRVQGERKFMTFYLPKLFIVGLLWLAAVTLGIWQTVNELHDPSYQYRVDTSNFQGMQVFFLIVGSLYMLYLVFLVVRACSELKNMPYFESQQKDNPAFSMLNDSDDDVLYGSDYEEMPLQNGRVSKSKYKDESDSD
ncbi:transmembrane protein 181 isoform X3 [Stegostoma tigrinum]|uniref:transmembrane protein 181 isoform X3 n=1 Tax=Stegostoma tigrinum TaxID=3053191 RepID=UPI0028700024|nr:transmembrane protein 181 isoform X3 [Stegostoma tigrinum]